ncbi:MAG: HAD family phosphatase [Vampirovibrionales bacterium]|nr:HAD family phosphatase [Vampirovibrionales bacterium]
MKPALIFDMDGVIVDSNPFHKLAWQEFCKKYHCEMNDEELKTNVYGKTNHDVVPFIFEQKLKQAPLSEAQIQTYTREKEQLFQDLFRPHITATPGLLDFLPIVQHWFSSLAIGTSAPTMNVNFTLDALGIRSFFPIIVDDTEIKNGKPDPEIYLTVAEKLAMAPKDCIVIEDSLAGVEAAKRAGMSVIGITTTHSKKELEKEVDLVIDDFSNIAGQLDHFLSPSHS